MTGSTGGVTRIEGNSVRQVGAFNDEAVITGWIIEPALYYGDPGAIEQKGISASRARRDRAQHRSAAISRPGRTSGLPTPARAPCLPAGSRLFPRLFQLIH